MEVPRYVKRGLNYPELRVFRSDILVPMNIRSEGIRRAGRNEGMDPLA